MSRRPNPQSAGWAEKSAEKLSRVALPTKIKCKDCNRKKAFDDFSNRQLDVARRNILKRKGDTVQVSDAGVVICMACLSPTHELHCISCDLVKSKDDFSGVQKRKPDEAVCTDCAAKIWGQSTGEEFEQETEDAEESNKNYDEDGEDSIHNSGDDENTRGGVMLGDDHSESASTWVAQPRYGGAAASRSQTGTQKSVSGSGTTFDKHKYGHPSSSVASHSVSSSPNKAGKASWNQSPSKASSVVDTGRWARPKNPNVPATVDNFDMKADWGKAKAKEDLYDDDDLP